MKLLTREKTTSVWTTRKTSGRPTADSQKKRCALEAQLFNFDILVQNLCRALSLGGVLIGALELMGLVPGRCAPEMQKPWPDPSFPHVDGK